MNQEQEWFLTLVRLGIGGDVHLDTLPDCINWESLKDLATRQGLFAVVFDGVEQLPQTSRPPLTTWLRWIGEVQLEEERFSHQWSEACKMAQLFHRNGVRTYVLKGNVVSECYPKPAHRVSADFDCFLLPVEGESGVWEMGNGLVEKVGYEVDRVFYKNSTFHLPGLMVENHQYMVPFRGNKTLRSLEKYLQNELKEDSRSSKGSSGSRFEGTELWKPPVMVSALFLIEHAYSHFLHEGLTWRHVLDWVMFSRKHNDEIDWPVFDALVDEFGFRRFYDSYSRMGELLWGEMAEHDLSKPEKKMLADIWAPLDLHETVRGFKGKLALAGNTLRARWKYHYFSEIPMPHALWIQVTGFLFEKNPKLN